MLFMGTSLHSHDPSKPKGPQKSQAAEMNTGKQPSSKWLAHVLVARLPSNKYPRPCCILIAYSSGALTQAISSRSADIACRVSRFSSAVTCPFRFHFARERAGITIRWALGKCGHTCTYLAVFTSSRMCNFVCRQSARHLKPRLLWVYRNGI